MYYGNRKAKSYQMLLYILIPFQECLFHMNFIYLNSYPMVLFPKDIFKHFGYAGPIGLFFNEHNFNILVKYFGKDDINLLIKALENYSIKDDLFSFIDSHIITDENEMNDSWKKFVDASSINKADYNISDYIERATIYKIHTRILSYIVNYIQDFKLPKKDL